jgi:uncharacterized ferritin-like protein (DUF455 family)
MTQALFAQAFAIQQSANEHTKPQATSQLRQDFDAGDVDLTPFALPREVEAGFPAALRLVSPRELPRRGLGTPTGRVALLHALAHIEFNAINLALDAVLRFQSMPRDFYADWLQVADEEARHFSMLQARLQELGSAYGQLPAHDGLWDMAQKTAHSLVARMALVPRVMEARGLDVTPTLIEKLDRLGDPASAEILRVIWEEEIGHVAIGTRWFHYACQQQQLAPEPTYFALLQQLLHGDIRGPLHHEARRQAGFSASELQRLEALVAQQASAHALA